MAIQYPIFFVVNTNVSTRNPANGEQFAGIWCQRTGHQVADPKYATPYFSRKGAQALVNRLTRSGINCPSWARKHTNNEDETGRYSIVTGTVTLDA